MNEELFRESLIEIFERDLLKLQEEIGSYPDENSLWNLSGEIKNSGGNLCLHIVGNLCHFIGAVLGGSDYVRNRDEEFSKRNVPREELISQINLAIKTVKETLSQLDPKDFEVVYPEHVFDKKMTAEFFLIHLATHLNYHLGQINYHRRLLAY
jgi:uncharacterized damage-inducible protein DinB